jgi:hypothetical protein
VRGASIVGRVQQEENPMKKFIALPLIAATVLGLSACTKQATNENVTVNDTSVNASLDESLSDNAATTVDNGANAADALTNG